MVKGKEVLSFGDETFLVYSDGKSLKIALGRYPLNFDESEEIKKSKKSKGKYPKNITSAELDTLKDLRISNLGEKYFLSYKIKKNGRNQDYSEVIDDLKKWENPEKSKLRGTSIIVPGYKIQNRFVAFFGDSSIKVALSKDLKKWEKEKIVLNPRKTKFDKGKLQPARAILTAEGILLFYYIEEGTKNKSYTLGAAVFDIKNPGKLLWRSEVPVWEMNKKDIKNKFSPIGLLYKKDYIYMYWNTNKGPSISSCLFLRGVNPIDMKKKVNPILEPNPENEWENLCTLNPAVIEKNGNIHLLYRAIGHGRVSVLGYAKSNDGIKIDKRLNEPAYSHIINMKSVPPKSVYQSGFGVAGCEDPRLTKMDEENKIYMTYNAFDGWIPRVALTSIKIKDFIKNKWNWETPVIISPNDQPHKNWIIFPEKIDDKYAILHSIVPTVEIEYRKSLNGIGISQPCIKSWVGLRDKVPLKEKRWEESLKSAGAPPIKTKDGWLVFYHAYGKGAPGYRIGAMLLDLKNPKKVLYRSMKPILVPDRYYEKKGFVSNVVYTCGAVVKGDNLLVYYGGADTVTSVASMNLNEFLEKIKENKEIELMPLIINTNKVLRRKRSADLKKIQR